MAKYRYDTGKITSLTGLNTEHSTGFAFGFAFKDMLSNFISGVIIFIYEPFKLGDSVEIEKKIGKVIDINLRYVTLETDTENILVPNSLCVSKVVVVNK